MKVTLNIGYSEIINFDCLYITIFPSYPTKNERGCVLASIALSPEQKVQLDIQMNKDLQELCHMNWIERDNNTVWTAFNLLDTPIRNIDMN